MTGVLKFSLVEKVNWVQKTLSRPAPDEKYRVAKQKHQFLFWFYWLNAVMNGGWNWQGEGLKWLFWSCPLFLSRMTSSMETRLMPLYQLTVNSPHAFTMYTYEICSVGVDIWKQQWASAGMAAVTLRNTSLSLWGVKALGSWNTADYTECWFKECEVRHQKTEQGNQCLVTC